MPASTPSQPLRDLRPVLQLMLVNNRKTNLPSQRHCSVLDEVQTLAAKR